MVADGQLQAGHARALLGTPDRSFQESLTLRIIKDELSVRVVEELVREHVWLTSPCTGEGDEMAESTYAFRHALFRQVLYERTAAAHDGQRPSAVR